MRNALCPFVLVVSALGLVACATSSPSDSSSSRRADHAGPTGRTSDGALLTLEAREDAPIWRSWEARGAVRTTPGRLSETVHAFDYWEIDDSAVIDDVWSALFPVLDSVRARSTSDAQRKSIQLLLEAIEPSRTRSKTRMDLTFVVSKDEANRFEGFACRLYRRLDDRGVTPQVTILFLHRLNQPASPDEIWVWGAPGFREPDPVTAVFRRGESRWQQAVVSGLSFPKASNGPSLSDGRAGDVAARVLTESIWKRFAGDSYLTSPQSGSESGRNRPEGVERALGLNLRDRRIKQVYSDTEFPPRAELEEL